MAKGQIVDSSVRFAQQIALEESEARYRHLVENTTDWVWTIDTENRHTYSNAAIYQLLGYRVDEIIGTSAFPLMFAEDEQPTRDLLKECLEKKVGWQNARFRWLHKDGTVRFFESSSVPLLDESGQIIGFSGIDRDITKRQQAEAALIESEERFRGLLQAVENVAVQGYGPDGIVQYWNQASERLYGYTAQEAIGRNLLDLTLPAHAGSGAGTMSHAGWGAGTMPETRAGAELALRQMAETGKLIPPAEVTRMRNDGSLVAVFSSYALVQLPGRKQEFFRIDIDLSERKRAEDALRQEKIFTDAIFNSVPGILYLFDEKGRLLRWNKKLAEMTGYSDEELDHFSILDWFKDEPEDIEIINKGMQTAFEQGFAAMEASLVTKSGAKILFEFTAARLDIDERVYLTGIGIDIGARRKVEEQVQADQVELQRLFAEAERSRWALLSVVEDQKDAEEQIHRLNMELEQRVVDRTTQLTASNQELEAFSFSVSHDLRAPLRALNGFSTALLSDYQEKLDQNGQHYLARIQEASQRMGQLIEDLLNLSRVTRCEMKLERIDFSLAARQIAAELQAQAVSDGREVKFEIEPDLIARADFSLIKIVLENLLGNATKFTGRRAQAHIKVGMFKRSGESVFFVQDDGAGFNMAYVDKLFIPFQRLHSINEFPGTGIGLAIAQRIIARHGGRIWPEAAVDEGTVFYFTLAGRGTGELLATT